MSSSPSVPADSTSPKSLSSDPTRFLHAAVAALLLVITFLGFKMFYLGGNAFPGHPIAPPAKFAVMAHGISMSCWILLSLVQPLLIVSGNRRVHMALGKVGAVLAIAIVYFGLRVPIITTRVEPEVAIWGLARRQFMAVPLISIVIFGSFVTIGIWQRNRPAIHRSMMLLATLTTISAATGRMPGLEALFAPTVFGTIWGPFFPALVIGAGFLLTKWALTKSFDRIFATGLAALAIACALIMQIAKTAVWVQFTTSLVGS